MMATTRSKHFIQGLNIKNDMKVIFTVVVVLFCSCSNKSIIGVYRGPTEVIELKQDSTFTYAFDAGWNKVRSLGTWKYLMDKKILLNSLYDYESIPITVKEGQIESDRLTIKVDPVTTLEPSVRDTLQYFIVFDKREIEIYPGINSKIPNDNIDAFRVEVRFPYKEDVRPYILHEKIFTRMYHIRDMESNYFAVSFPLDFDMFYSDQVDNEIVSVKGNKFYWPSKSKAPFTRKD